MATRSFEAFLLHVRVLDEFIYGDVVAVLGGAREPVDLEGKVSPLEFVADPQAWLDARPLRTETLRRRRISRTVAHLTWSRVKAGWEPPDLSSKHLVYQKEQKWPVPEVWDALRPVLIAFLDHVDHGVVCDEFALWADQALSG